MVLGRVRFSALLQNTMILTEIEVLEIIKGKKEDCLKEAIELQDAHKVHIVGDGFDNVLQQIQGYEDLEQFKQKKLLSKPFTRPLLKYIMDTQSRWKNAQGTSKYYNFSGENKEVKQNEFKNTILSTIWKGASIDDFTKKFLSKAIYSEFNGYILVEKEKIINEGGKKYVKRGEITKAVDANYIAKPYLIFIPAEQVYDFEIEGNNIEYIAIDFTEQYKLNKKDETLYYRVLDDVYDYVIEKKKGENTDWVTSISTVYPPYEHKAGKTPVSSISLRNKYLNNDEIKTSPIDELIPHLDYYLNRWAEHSVSCILHDHPIYYEVGSTCEFTSESGHKCEGGYINYERQGESIQELCPNCKGSKHNNKKDAASVKIIPARDETGAGVNYSNVAGYVMPPIDSLKHQVEELDWHEGKIMLAATNSTNFQQEVSFNKTATEIVYSTKPLEDLIGEIIDNIQFVEKAVTDIAGKIYYGEKYLGSEILYGRKLNLKDENTLLIEIAEAKKSGANYQYVKSLVEELVYTRFANSPVDLQENIVYLEIEPLVGYTIKEVEDSKYISETTKVIKQNFIDFIERYELEFGEISTVENIQENKANLKKIKDQLLLYAQEVVAANKVQIEQTQIINN